MIDDLKLIKKYYGEEMMHLCRTLFPTILETPGTLFKLMSDNFAYSKFLYEDLKDSKKDFQNYILNLAKTAEERLPNLKKTPFELMKEAGYILKECRTESDIQSYKKYFKENEQLCTFEGGRLLNNYVFFAVKDNVDDIKRENFKHPKRQDEYGTSVISIQFTRGSINTLSIKNRYNHTVKNPDATYSNNLENIIPGLTKSFENEYDLNINQTDNTEVLLENYIKASDGKLYKYNYEINNVYYCPNNIIIDNFNVVKEYNENKERYIIIDYFIIDRKEKKITLYDKHIKDGFINSFEEIEDIQVKNIDNQKKLITIKSKEKEEIEIIINKYNEIISLKNNNIEQIENNFLSENKKLEHIELLNVKSIKNKFLFKNNTLEKIELPNLETVESEFLKNNKSLKEYNFQTLKSIKNNFLSECQLKKVILPNLIEVQDGFMENNRKIEEIYIPKLERVNNNFLCNSNKLKLIYTPNIKQVGDSFLESSELLEEASFPNLEIICSNFMSFATNLKRINVSNTVEIGNHFLSYNQELEQLYLPKLKVIRSNFLEENRKLKRLYIQNIKAMEFMALKHNLALEELNAPLLEKIGGEVLVYNNNLKIINMPSIKSIRESSLTNYRGGFELNDKTYNTRR